MDTKRRMIEHGKTLLIVLLSISAVVLLSRTQLVQDSGVAELLNRPRPHSGEKTVSLTVAAKPAAIMISDGIERYAVQYDQNEVDSLFTRLSPLLGEALSSAGEPEPLGEYLWRSRLKSAGAYFDFSGEVPLSALGSWLQRESQCALTHNARRLVLSLGTDDRVYLCYQEGESGEFFSCSTELSGTLHLMPVLSGISGNAGQFAFESGNRGANLEPYTLMTDRQTSVIYTGTTPITPKGNLGTLLEALDYTGRNHASVSDGELYLDGNDRLRVLSSGQVMFSAAQPGKYPVPTAGEEMTAAEAIEAARKLAESTIGAFCGEAQLYLISARQNGDGYQIRFGYRLNGSSVWLYEGGWAAEFLLREGCIMEFTLRLRSYAATDSRALLLPMDRAAVMLPDLSGEKRELVIQYRDLGQSAVEPAWVAK